MDQSGPPRVTLVYYSYTQQTKHVIEAMGEVFTARGYDVRLAPIEFTDKRWTERFHRFPMRHVWIDLLRMLPAQMRGATGEIGIPPEAGEGGSNLVVIGSPTWFFRTNIPVRSFLKSPEAGVLLDGTPFAVVAVCRRYWSLNLKNVRSMAVKRGGRFVDGTPFKFEGGQVRSLLSLISYLGHGEMRDRYLGIRIPPSNLQPDGLDAARSFANRLADGLDAADPGGPVAG
jgi:hypothetical protein